MKANRKGTMLILEYLAWKLLFAIPYAPRILFNVNVARLRVKIKIRLLLRRLAFTIMPTSELVVLAVLLAHGLFIANMMMKMHK